MGKKVNGECNHKCRNYRTRPESYSPEVESNPCWGCKWLFRREHYEDFNKGGILEKHVDMEALRSL